MYGTEFGTSYSRIDTKTVERRAKPRTLAQVAQPGDRLFPGDQVMYDGKPIKWEAMNTEETAVADFLYLKFWKPAGVVCTTDQSIAGNVVDAVSPREDALWLVLPFLGCLLQGRVDECALWHGTAVHRCSSLTAREGVLFRSECASGCSLWAALTGPAQGSSY